MAGSTERRFLIVAGEASGDAHAARLVDCLRECDPCRVRGVAGPAMVAAGVEPIADLNDLAVLGFSGVIARLPRIWRIYQTVLREAQTFQPHAVVLVDSPGFNFRLGPALRARGARLYYYIAPQVWAWHPERAKTMRRWVERLAVVFPFEEQIFREAGVTTRFVGHPLLDALEPEVSRAAFDAELGLAPGAPFVGFLPGSRTSEVQHHLPAMLGAARALRSVRSDLVAVIPLAPGLADDDLRRAGLAWQSSKGSSALEVGRTQDGVVVVRSRTRAVQAYATACAVASGTATLETALFGTPLVIVYRAGRLNYRIARRMVTLSRIGLPNIVAGQEVAPELIQDALTADALARSLAPMIDDEQVRSACRQRLAVVRERLGEPGASRRAAEWLSEMVS